MIKSPYLCGRKIKTNSKRWGQHLKFCNTIMAKYTITHTCGHQVEVQLFGKYADREKQIARMESCKCSECLKAEANAKAAQANENRGLAELTGSEKQIAWAETIRSRVYECLDNLVQFANNDKSQDMIKGWREKMNAQVSAAWWIDNRDALPKYKEDLKMNVRSFNTVLS